MKFLLCILLLALSSQVIFCDDANIVKMINEAVPQILQGGIGEGKLPCGPYYLHHVIKSSIGAQDSRVTLDVRGLDNQTIVTVKATIDNVDFSVKTSCFTSKIGEDIMALSQGAEFQWMGYAPHGYSEYCYYPGEYEYIDGTYYQVRDDQFVSDSVIKKAYEYLEEAKNGDWKKDILDELDPNVPMGPILLLVGVDSVKVYQFVGKNSWGDDYYMSSVIQPCTGNHYVYYNVNIN